ncbi:uncharacterized protein LOC141605317 [Silene latifolia]|uniref:uncharacterized protein LOC141605317 n=1 Tax=Silene latifolia TaxID=37657 RepID=UPI003D78AB60
MCELSVAEGFVEINENLGDMIKYVANEPSVGLFYIQQHAQNAVPNVVKLKNNVTEKSTEVTFHTEDLEDSIVMTRTMKECGFPIINDMIRDIKTSLTLISSKQPVRGVISQRSSSFQVRGTSPWAPMPWGQGTSTTRDDSVKPESYFSSVLKSAKEKAVNLNWAHPHPTEASEITEVLPPDEDEELPLSSQVENEIVEETNVSTDGKTQQSAPVESDFEEFKAEREAFLEEWLTSSGTIL